jgi:hypothetical protein
MALPSPSTLSSTTRYIPAGVRRYSWVPTIANKNAPTSAELSAGTDITAEVMAVNGFQVQSTTVDAPDAGTRYTAKVPGRITADNSSLTIYITQVAGTDIRSLLTRDLAGYVVIYAEGIVTSKTCDIFPVRITGVPKTQDIEGVACVDVEFAVTSTPVENLTIPVV